MKAEVDWVAWLWDGAMIILGVVLAGLLMELLACGAQGGSVQLAWNAVPDTNVAGYYVYYGVQAGNPTNRIDTSCETNVVVTNLLSGNTYSFAVTSRDSFGYESVFSEWINYWVPMPPVLVPGSALVRQPVVFEASTDLRRWAPEETNYAWTTRPSSNGAVFVRARLLPLTIQLEP